MLTHTYPFCGLPFGVVAVLCVLVTLGWWVLQTVVNDRLATRRMDRAEKRREAFYVSREADRHATRRPRQTGIIYGKPDDEDWGEPSTPVSPLARRRPFSQPRSVPRGYIATPRDEEEAADEVAASHTAELAELDAEILRDRGIIE